MGLLDKIKNLLSSENQYVSTPVRYDVDISNKKVKNNANTFKFKVVGVTFKNGRKSRQTILRKIKWKDEPFDGNVNYTLQVYDYEGKFAVGVYANGEQIGNVPKEYTSFVIEHISKIQSISVKVYGGGKSENGEQKSLGAEATLILK